jgi:hypothetical protein
MDRNVWMTPGSSGGFVHALAIDGLGDQIEFAEAQHPIGHLAVLRGLCHRALPYFYETTEDRLILDRGYPVPFATRPIPVLFDDSTPYQPTLMNGKLMENTGFRLFESAAGAEFQVALDFRHRQRIDEITWIDRGRLPRVTTVHPYFSTAERDPREVHDKWWFDVRPSSPDMDALLDLLREGADAEIAVLPELCLPQQGADALGDALARRPQDFPPLVVAGSAHVREPSGSYETRANESRTYLDGELVSVHRKIHPFHARLPGHGDPLPEGLTREARIINVLSGEHTRLAVVICADLNDADIPRALENAGVNLLLAPALTDEVGAFNGAICGLASRCQGMSVIVNSRLDPTSGGQQPFAVMASVPRSSPGRQSREYPPDAGSSVGKFDPNVELAAALEWL